MVPVKYETLMIWLFLNMLKARLCLAHVNSLNAVVRAVPWRAIVEHMLPWVSSQTTAAVQPDPKQDSVEPTVWQIDLYGL